MDIAKLVLLYGADFTIKDKRGKTPFDSCIYQIIEEIILKALFFFLFLSFSVWTTKK